MSLHSFPFSRTQFDQKEHKSFLGPRKDYWDFLCTALRRQRGDTEQTRFICSQEKVSRARGAGRLTSGAGWGSGIRPLTRMAGAWGRSPGLLTVMP